MPNEETQQTTTEETTEETNTADTTETQATENGRKDGESQEDYRARLNAQNRFLEKEGYEFKDGKWHKAVTTTAQAPSLSAQDIIALRDVHEDDIGSIQEWAKFKGVSLAEARKDKDLNTILSARAEERRTEAATQTRGGSRGATKPSGTDLLAKAIRTNELPEDDEGMLAIAEARQPRKKA